MGRELSTFGAILRYAIELEDGAAALYERAATAASEGTTGPALAALAKAHRKRQRDCERMRREQVTEMILEPIYGLQEDDWRVDMTLASGAASAERERRLGAFYAQAATKVSVPEVARYLRRLAQEAVALEAQAGTLP
jgi:hypothetical protein